MNMNHQETSFRNKIAYAAVETFDSTYGDKWANYIAWSGLKHLQEVISFDILLCPGIVRLTSHFGGDPAIMGQTGKFCDNLDYLFTKVKSLGIKKSYQVIATIAEPTEDDVRNFIDDRFVLKGFDLLENLTGISALTNCGGFDLAFSGYDINIYGLVTEYRDAYKIRDSLLVHYPNEAHANCVVWALWRMERSPS
jgi:hypothetical protein